MKWVKNKTMGNNATLGILLSFVTVLFAPIFAFSQTLPTFQVPSSLLDQVPDANMLIQDTRNEYLKKSVILTTDPQYPGPLQDVSLALSSASTDLSRAAISWYVNGVLAKKGTGETALKVHSGRVGEKTTVDVVVMMVEGVRADKEVIINPADLDLLWEADSYTPPFYKGKALPLPSSNIKIVALPSFFSGGKQLDPKTFVYSWKNEGTDTRFVNDSGYGRSILRTTMPLLPRDMIVTANVSSLGGSITTEKQVAVTPETPHILFYESNPLEGVLYENTIAGGTTIGNEDFSIKAEPYYFSRSDRLAGKLTYGWSLNGKPITPDTNEGVTFRRVGDGVGSFVATLDLRSLANIFEQASESLTLSFKNQ